MTELAESSIDFPSAVSPADADAYRVKALSALEEAKGGSTAVTLGIDGTDLTPVTIQLLVATTRTAERLGVKLDFSEQCQGVLTELQSQ